MGCLCRDGMKQQRPGESHTKRQELLTQTKAKFSRCLSRFNFSFPYLGPSVSTPKVCLTDIIFI